MLYNWQTLIGGLIAIGAALYAGRYIRKQIDAGDRLERDRVLRRERAVRAVLPITLTKFIDFSEECANVLRQAQVPGLSASSGGTPLSRPEVPQQAISDLERAIEVANDPKTIAIMTKLAGHSQVLHSIISDIVMNVNTHGRRRYRNDPNMPVFEIRAARVHAAASQLFSWARGEADEPEEVSWAHVEQSLSLLNLGNDRTAKFVTRKREKGTDSLAW